eukprot:TRINITY_DN4855_c0_g1_i1.p3 TRINITY_DN4855_c0_g1~~TRINITY_DN4855_c0_g1_i1.p3  ORF type:complete len:121 (-),score=51.40 TRINITY_DN4855_c0_g1_i1:536-898(-)
MPAARRGKLKPLKFVIDASIPAADKIFDPTSFETFLSQKIKVDGKVGNLGDKVKITRDGSSITIVATPPFSKRYLKYLTKKYLKKQQLRDWLRVIATDKQSYQIKYFTVEDEESGEEEDE